MPSYFKSNLLEHCYIFLWLLKFFTFFNNLSTVLVLWILALPFCRNWSLKGCVILFWKIDYIFLSSMIFDVVFPVVETEQPLLFWNAVLNLLLYHATLWNTLLSLIYSSLYHFTLPFSSLILRWWLSRVWLIICALCFKIYTYGIYFSYLNDDYNLNFQHSNSILFIHLIFKILS